jgi:hypothetical protein
MTSEKEAKTIVVNAVPRQWTEQEVSYDQVVNLAFPNPSAPNVTYTIEYERGEGHKPAGSLVQGQSVKVKDKMVFSVTETGRS